MRNSLDVWCLLAAGCSDSVWLCWHVFHFQFHDPQMSEEWVAVWCPCTAVCSYSVWWCVSWSWSPGELGMGCCVVSMYCCVFIQCLMVFQGPDPQMSEERVGCVVFIDCWVFRQCLMVCFMVLIPRWVRNGLAVWSPLTAGQHWATTRDRWLTSTTRNRPWQSARLIAMAESQRLITSLSGKSLGVSCPH